MELTHMYTVQSAAQPKELSGETLAAVDALLKPPVKEDKAQPEAPKFLAYRLSMPLMISAQAGDRGKFKTILAQFDVAIQAIIKKEDLNWKALMLGRKLAAQVSIAKFPNNSNIQKTRLELETLINEINRVAAVENPGVENPNYTDPLLAWAVAYLVENSPKVTYDTFKVQMMERGKALNDQHIAKRENHLKSSPSDAVWTWAIGLRASANAGDKITFTKIQRHISELYDDKFPWTIALKDSLGRNLSDSDFPAWAMASAYVGALIIGEKALSDVLKLYYEQSVASAREFKGELIEVIKSDAETQEKFAKENCDIGETLEPTPKEVAELTESFPNVLTKTQAEIALGMTLVNSNLEKLELAKKAGIVSRPVAVLGS